ncbi:MAG: TrmB family transcriptional regulator [Vampirovibrionia bacterium]
MDELLNKLKNLGFNTYEAKVYLSLLKHHPATGYEVSKESGVPQARAYDTLKVLETRNIVVSTGKKPVTYIPINPHEILDKNEKSYMASLEFLRENLPSIAPDYVEPVLNIRGSKGIFEYAIDGINSAEKEIFLELWNEDFEMLKPALENAKEKGVDIKIVSYGDLKTDLGTVYPHGLEEEIEQALGGRWLILAVDSTNGIAGTVSETENVPQAVCTRHPGIVLIIKEVVVHDIYLIEVERKLGKEMVSIFGKNMIKLREQVLGKNFKVSMH